MESRFVTFVVSSAIFMTVLLLLDRDGGLDGPRGQAARTCLYLFERDQAVGLIRSG